MKQNQRLETAGPGQAAAPDRADSGSRSSRPARVGVVHRKPRVSGWLGWLQRSLRLQMHHVLTGGLLVLGFVVIAALVHLVGNDGHWTAPRNRLDDLLARSNSPLTTTPPAPPSAGPRP